MKRIKMILYGEPGTGKSVFASRFPKPFFITTDGNYEWLEEFGADMDAHIQVNSWSEAKKAFTMNFDNYETIVVDLTEDLFKWCEYEYCKKNKLDHVSDVGYGKGYDITRNDFIIELSKLIGLDKHIVFIMHGKTITVKDRRGVEHTKHVPSDRMPDKVIDALEGRVRYFLRCYTQAEEGENKTLIKKRYLSLIPKENEFGICIGLDENVVPHDIPLDFDAFADAIGLYKNSTVKKQPIKEMKKEKVDESTSEIKTSSVDDNTPKETEKITSNEKDTIESKEDVIESKEDVIEGQISIDEVKEESVEPENKPEIKEDNSQSTKNEELSNDEKLAALKAKLAALKGE